MCASYYTNSHGVKLAYVHLKAEARGQGLPALVFLGGFKSDMSGTKALFLEERCRREGREFLRFDYTGHGESGGAFTDGTIGLWLEDAREMLVHVLEAQEVILVGSSMGGWLALRMLIDPLPEGGPQISGVVGIAAAPDFTVDLEAQMGPEERALLDAQGYIEEPNDYSEEPYIFTGSLFEDGRRQSLLHPERPYKTGARLLLLQGKEDHSVYWEKALQIEKAFDAPQSRVVFIEDGDHSLSRPEDLALLDEQITQML